MEVRAEQVLHVYCVISNLVTRGEECRYSGMKESVRNVPADLWGEP